MNSYAERFRTALQIIKRKLAQNYKTQLDSGLTTPQFYILYLIRETGPCKVTMLAEQMEVKPSAITVMIDRLVNQGFVTRESDAHDRRVVLVQITEEGQRVVKKVEQHSNDTIGHYFSSLSPAEIEQMILTLEKITGGMLVQDNGVKTKNGNDK